MLKIYPMDVETFVQTTPEKRSIAISFVTKIDRLYDKKLYDELPNVYQQYDDVLVLNVDDIREPHGDLNLFTKDDAKRVINFISKNFPKNIYVHCNAGVSRTGSIVTYVLKHYPNYKLGNTHQFTTNPHITKLLEEVAPKRIEDIDITQENVNEFFNSIDTDALVDSIRMSRGDE